MEQTDKRYWKKYYNRKRRIQRPSQFAKWVLKELNKGSLIDLGCGDGRDSIFFKSNGFDVTSVDQVDSLLCKVRFIKGDISKLASIKKYNNIYIRFVLHSLNIKQEKRLLDSAYLSLVSGGKLFIEVRTVDDEWNGIGKRVGKNEYITTHYRRFIEPNELEKALKDIGFKIKYLKCRRGWAKYKGENPKVMRCIVTK